MIVFSVHGELFGYLLDLCVPGGGSEEKIETVFKPMSVDVKFHDVQGKNYRCAIPKLNKEIVPEKCKVVVKPSRVILTLCKASKGNWLDLHFKEDKVSYDVLDGMLLC